MNHVATPAQRWPTMVPTSEDDFANFLDLTDLNFQAFNDGDAQTPTEPTANSHRSDASGPLDTSMDASVGLLGLEQQQQQQQQQQQHGNHSQHMSDVSHPSGQMQALNAFPEAFNLDPALYNQARQHQMRMQQRQQQQQQHRQHQHQQQQQQRYRPPNMVPPTPNSIELHGGQVSYFQPPLDPQQQHQLYEQYRLQQQKEQSFTPLVSPAVTPLDTQFLYTEYAGSTDSFSPLTSPALRAQNHSAHNSVYGNVRGSDTPDTSSPVDFNLDYSVPTSASTSSQGRKPRRRVSSGSAKTPSRAVKQSPAMKAQSKRKQASSAVIPPKSVDGILEEASQQADANNLTAHPDGKGGFLQASAESSGQDSVSPEPLSEILMPPPATARNASAGRSPYLKAQQGSVTANATGAPATPASLMRIRKQNEKTQPERSNLRTPPNQANGTRNEIVFSTADTSKQGASTAKRPNLQNIDTSQANATPKSSRQRTPGKAPISAPPTANTSKYPSPSSSALASPVSAALEKGKDAKRNRDSKNRGNSNSDSAKASPALRPRISPSIKPLLPEGAQVSAETSALLLATKSNYQNILEGTHFPGVSFPETLSTNLTSKRTSHKIAEQGRRNRINTALHEIASLLPPATPPAMAKSPSQNANANATTPTPEQTQTQTQTQQQQNNSKASTVEAAIEYIKSLQREVQDCRAKLALYEGTSTSTSNTPAGRDTSSSAGKSDSDTEMDGGGPQDADADADAIEDESAREEEEEEEESKMKRHPPAPATAAAPTRKTGTGAGTAGASAGKGSSGPQAKSVRIAAAAG